MPSSSFVPAFFMVPSKLRSRPVVSAAVLFRSVSRVWASVRSAFRSGTASSAVLPAASRFFSSSPVLVSRFSVRVMTLSKSSRASFVRLERLPLVLPIRSAADFVPLLRESQSDARLAIRPFCIASIRAKIFCTEARYADWPDSVWSWAISSAVMKSSSVIKPSFPVAVCAYSVCRKVCFCRAAAMAAKAGSLAALAWI